VAQVHLDRLWAEEERLGDLPVREAVPGHRRDPALARGEPVSFRGLRAAGAGPRGEQLGAGPFRNEGAVAGVGEVEPPAERLAGSAMSIGSEPLGGTTMAPRPPPCVSTSFMCASAASAAETPPSTV
jgi:hypothetical protein